MQFGSDCARMLSQHHSSKAILVGHSMGGIEALHMLHSLGPAAPILAVITIAAPLSGPVIPATPTTLHVYAAAQRAVYNPHHGTPSWTKLMCVGSLCIFMFDYCFWCPQAPLTHGAHKPQPLTVLLFATPAPLATDPHSGAAIFSVCSGRADWQVQGSACTPPGCTQGLCDDWALWQSSTMTGVWATADHQASVWCHQLVSRLSRAMLAGASTPGQFAASAAAVLHGMSV